MGSLPPITLTTLYMELSIPVVVLLPTTVLLAFWDKANFLAIITLECFNSEPQIMPAPPDETTQYSYSGRRAAGWHGLSGLQRGVLSRPHSKEGHDSSIELEFGRREPWVLRFKQNGLCSIEASLKFIFFLLKMTLKMGISTVCNVYSAVYTLS